MIKKPVKDYFMLLTYFCTNALFYNPLNARCSKVCILSEISWQALKAKKTVYCADDTVRYDGMARNNPRKISWITVSSTNS